MSRCRAPPEPHANPCTHTTAQPHFARATRSIGKLPKISVTYRPRNTDEIATYRFIGTNPRASTPSCDPLAPPEHDLSTIKPWPMTRATVFQTGDRPEGRSDATLGCHVGPMRRVVPVVPGRPGGPGASRCLRKAVHCPNECRALSHCRQAVTPPLGSQRHATRLCRDIIRRAPRHHDKDSIRN